MAIRAKPAPSRPKDLVDFMQFNPNDLVDRTGKLPSFFFKWREPGKKKGEKTPSQRRRKRRLMSIPSREMHNLHDLFKVHLEIAIDRMGQGNDNKDNYTLRKFPSATGCVRNSNHFKNGSLHAKNRFFYITDFKDAYPSVDLRRLAALLVFIFKYDRYRSDYSVRQFGRNELAQYAMETDPMFEDMFSFVRMAFGGLHGEGLAVGGRLSPYLLNLYCEVFFDSRVRQYCERLENPSDPRRKITYSRYVDDLVWSSDTIISSERRRELRQMIADAGFSVNHWKSKVLDRRNGTVFVTKVGLEDRDQKHVLVFPKQKRCRLEGLIKSYLAEPFQGDNPEVITGIAAEFLHYHSLAKAAGTLTETDRRTFRFCKKFESAAAPYLTKLRKERERGKQEKEEKRQMEKIRRRHFAEQR